MKTKQFVKNWPTWPHLTWSFLNCCNNKRTSLPSYNTSDRLAQEVIYMREASKEVWQRIYYVIVVHHPSFILYALWLPADVDRSPVLQIQKQTFYHFFTWLFQPAFFLFPSQFRISIICPFELDFFYIQSKFQWIDMRSVGLKWLNE